MTCYIPESQPGKEVYSVPIKSSYFLICILTAQNVVVKIWENALSTESKCERAASGSAQDVCLSGWEPVHQGISSALLTDPASLPQWGDPSAGLSCSGVKMHTTKQKVPRSQVLCFQALCKPAAATTATQKPALPFPTLPVAITKSRFFSVLQVAGSWQ